MKQKVNPAIAVVAVVLIVVVLYALYQRSGTPAGPEPKAEDAPAYTKKGGMPDYGHAPNSGNGGGGAPSPLGRPAPNAGGQ